MNLGSVSYRALGENQQIEISRLYDFNRLFSIVPTEETTKLLLGQRMLSKTTSNGLMVGVELKDGVSGNQSLVSIDSNLRLRFALVLKDKQLINYTALPTRTDGLYYFSNDSGNTAAGNYLSRTVGVYDVDKSYEAGELYLQPTGPGEGLFQTARDTGPEPIPVSADWTRIPANTYDSTVNYSLGEVVLEDDVLYEAVINSPSTDLSDTSQWLESGQLANQFVTGEDYLPLHIDRLLLDVSSEGITQALVSIISISGSVSVFDQEFSSESGNLDAVTVSIMSLPAGAYRLEVRDSSQTLISNLNYSFYCDPHALKENWFALIEIGAGSGDFALQDGSMQLRNPTYTINFLNRSTRWRYVFPHAQALGVGALVSQEDSEGRIHVTENPLPLTRFGRGIPLQIDSTSPPSVSEEVLLPEPGVNRIRYQSQQWYSEIHLSNLPL